MYRLSEVKLWLRTWLLCYRFSEFSYQEHLAIIEQVKNRIGEGIYSPDDATRLTLRSVAQYLSQSGLRPARSRLATEIISCVMLPCALGYWVCRGLLSTRSPQPRVRGLRWNQDEFRYWRNTDIYHTPEELLPDAPQTVFVSARYLRLDDIKFLWQTARIAWPFLGKLRIQWLAKIAKEIAFARPLVDTHPADYALMDNECNCAISILTLYARRHGQQLYTVQHGDLFLSVMTSFFETDRSYCWDNFYVELFKRMQASSNFRLYNNPKFTFTKEEKNTKRSGIGVFMPGIQTIPTEDEKNTFVQALNTLAEEYPVHLRPHPAYVNQCEALVPLLSKKVTITNSQKETSKQFIARHNLILGTVSAAILEAIMLGRPVVCFRGILLDDVASYHFCYKKPNCRLCQLPELVETVRAELTASEQNHTVGA